MRPCPFCCGTKLLLKKDNLGYSQIACETCGAKGPRSKKNAESKTKWNERDPNQHLFELEQKPPGVDLDKKNN